ncbi:hypothetical protein SKAU_G00331410 [Synaphobranchus kaupii]|uniref:Fucolectin tachylectin-4 pentraxin-1 domain-containing protein n=1 Tax=Synaphobranchus kaupii TaxID=118154 RepID=A0A9Q1EL77_SYNKA|nr:hypothetical protein SKAU_G00331410 [Synaphobranchus kaupii]
MKVKMMILLFQILAISTLKLVSALDISDKHLENVAVRGTATQSTLLRSTDGLYGHADNAIDGNRDSTFIHASCSHTNNDANPWWRVDLLEEYVVASVTITGLVDCCAERINGAEIHIGNSLVNNGIDNQQMKVKMMILLFQILAISTLKLVSALDISDKRLENVALRGRPASRPFWRSEQSVYSHAGNSIDGNRDSNLIHGSCSITHNDANPWWRVDLLEEYVVASVTITNRGDCVVCATWIIGAQITIGDSLENNGIDNPQCSVVSSLAAGETKTFQCDVPLSGRYVTVYLPRRDYLEICEVEVNAWVPAA